MSNTVIVLIIVAVGITLMVLHHQVIVKPKASVGGGVAAFNAVSSAAEKIPVYGSFVSAGKVVVKPVNHVLEKVNGAITTGLQHIPIAGKYLAMPNQIAGSAIHKINSFFGLT